MEEKNKTENTSEDKKLDAKKAKVQEQSNEVKKEKNESKKETSKVDTKKEEKPKKKAGSFKKSILFIFAIVIVCAIASLVYFIGFAPRAIDLSQFITIDYEGYDGRATATVSANKEALSKNLKDDDLVKKFVKKIEENIELSEYEDLSNGDEIEIKVDISDSWLENNRIKLKSNTFKITVENLEEAGTLDIEDYINVEYTGFNGYATAKVSIDVNSLAKTIDNEDLAKQISNKVTLEVTDNGNLSNGDKVKIKISIDEDWLEENGYKIKSKTATLDAVEDLEEATVLNAFADISVTVSGMSPNLKASVTNNSSNEFLKTVKYTLSKSTEISNGETITITANYNKEDAKEQGIVLEKDTYEYTVTAEVSYPMSVSELSATTIEAMKTTYLEKARAEANANKYIPHDKITDYRVAGENAGFRTWYDEKWELDISIGEPVLSSMYLLTAKDTTNTFNIVYAIYRIPFTSAITGISYDWYFTVEAVNVSVKSDGSLTENATYDVKYWVGASQEAAYNEYINSKKNNYTVEAIQ